MSSDRGFVTMPVIVHSHSIVTSLFLSQHAPRGSRKVIHVLIKWFHSHRGYWIESLVVPGMMISSTKKTKDTQEWRFYFTADSLIWLLSSC